MAEVVQLPAALVAGLRAVVTVEEMGEFFGRAMSVAAALPTELFAGPATAVYHRDEHTRFDVTVGLRVSARTGVDGVDVAELPAGAALRVLHAGRYEDLGEAYAELGAALAEQGLTRTISWENYLVGPGDDPDPAAWRTEVVVPLPPDGSAADA